MPRKSKKSVSAPRPEAPPALQPGDDPKTQLMPAIELPATARDPAKRPTVDAPSPLPVTAASDYLRAAGVELLNGPDDGRVYPLLHDEVVIGRDPKETASIVIADDPRVSRRHMRLTWRDGQWWAADLGSANGIQRLNDGAAIDSAPTPLDPDQPLRLGGTHLRLVLLPADHATEHPEQPDAPQPPGEGTK